MTDETPLSRRLRAAGLRPTPARLSTLEVLAGTSGSLRAEGIYRRLIERGMPISVSVLYRALQTMCEAGLLIRLWDSDRAVRYGFIPDIAPNPLFYITSHAGQATFSDFKLYTQLLAAAAKTGLKLGGKEFTLHVRLEPQAPAPTQYAARDDPSER